MEPIKYNDDSFTVRGEYPERVSDNAESITEVTFQLLTDGGSSLVDETAATLYTATTISSDAVHGDMYVVLAEGSDAPNHNDRFLIGVSFDGRAEQVICDRYDSDNRYMYLSHELQFSHTAGAAVVGLWATYVLDASDTDTYYKGRELRAVWNPDTDDEAWSQLYMVSGVSAAPPGFWAEFQAIYPDEYETATNRDLSVLERTIRARFKHEFTSRGMDVGRIVDSDRLSSGMILFARYVLSDSEIHMNAWTSWFKILCDDPIWIDENQDGIKTDDEVQIHSAFDPIMRHI
jgi:hypothetical protein